jgi:hypothetical protein
MFEKLKMKLAARKMQRSKEYAALGRKIMNEESEFERVLLWPFRAIGFVCRWIYDTIAAIVSWIWGLLVAVCVAIWAWLCAINIVGLINLTLVLAIIILFSFLIVDFTRCRHDDIANTQKNPVAVETLDKTSTNGAVTTTLPLRRGANALVVNEPINIVGAEPSRAPTLRKRNNDKIYGDIIIESHGDAIILKNNAHIRGNLYLQHMRKYVLPCGIKIEGNLFLRDLNMLQFCGPFNITGNIYVSPRSSFGPIPRNSRLGGQIIL